MIVKALLKLFSVLGKAARHDKNINLAMPMLPDTAMLDAPLKLHGKPAMFFGIKGLRLNIVKRLFRVLRKKITLRMRLSYRARLLRRQQITLGGIRGDRRWRLKCRIVCLSKCELVVRVDRL